MSKPKGKPAGAPSFTHSPGSCLGMGREVREEPVKVPEIGKRSACYHSLRKGSETCGLANLTRCAHIKKRVRRTIAGHLQPKGARTHINKGGPLRAAMLMIKRDNTSSITPASTAMGILMENELLLLEAVQGKGVLRSLQFPADVSEPGRLLDYPWDAVLHSAWLMPATTLSRPATCS